jgi:hypothetical protein
MIKWYTRTAVLLQFIAAAAEPPKTTQPTDELRVTVAVVGQGPAGLSAACIVHESGIPYNQIALIDEKFNVGRIGEHYSSVPANTMTKGFINFMQSCKTFQECRCPAFDALYKYDQETEYPLRIIVQPLQCVSDYLCKKAIALKGTLKSLYFEDNLWHLTVNTKKVAAKFVILATGAHPRKLDYDCSDVIPLDMALDITQLKRVVEPKDTVVVVGSAHSAILLLKFLSELNVKKIINLYNKPIRYATDMGTWVLWDDSGIRGIAARWAQEVLEKNPPKNLIRYENTEENRKKALADKHTKIIYACGFERNDLPYLKDNPTYGYNEATGVIAPRLFGIGIAFPEKYTDPLGNVESAIGLFSFMLFAQKMVPFWLSQKSELRKIDEARCEQFADLFTINAL